MKRLHLTISISLLLGAVINIGVAWGCIRWSSSDASELYKATRHDRTWWRRHAPATFNGSASDVCKSDGFGVVATTRGAPEFSLEQINGVPTITPRWMVAQEIRIGWPFQTFSGERWTRCRAMLGPPVIEHKTVYTWSQSLGPALLSSNDVQEWKLLPLRPLLIGFALNGIFYAVLLWLFASGPLVLRRFSRGNRGHCAICGYDLRYNFANGCPECGWRRKETDAEQPA